MPEDAIHYYLNLTESEIDPTVAALSVIILSQSITVTTMSYEKVMLPSNRMDIQYGSHSFCGV